MMSDDEKPAWEKFEGLFKQLTPGQQAAFINWVMDMEHRMIQRRRAAGEEVDFLGETLVTPRKDPLSQRER